MAYGELAFQFAKEVSTQLITLSSALIGLSVTFIKDFQSESPGWLRASWLLYIASIVFGVLALLTLTGTLETLALPASAFGGFYPSTRITAGAQIVSFVLGTVCLIVFGWRHGLKRHASSTPSRARPDTPRPVRHEGRRG